MAAISAASGPVAPDAAFGATSGGTAGDAFGGASDDIEGKAFDGVAGVVADAIFGVIFAACFGATAGTACAGNSEAAIITGGGAGCGSGASQTVASRTTCRSEERRVGK